MEKVLINEAGLIVRRGDGADLAVGTYVRLREALAADDRAAVRSYWEVFTTEIATVRHLVALATADLQAAMQHRWGVSTGDLAATHARLCTLLAHPDGRPFDPVADLAAFDAAAAGLADALHAGDHRAGVERLPALKEQWRQVHDRSVDYIGGLLDLVVVRFGEEAIGETMRLMNASAFAERYASFDISARSWDEILPQLVDITFESARGHLTGPDREGSVSYEELPDRHVWTWDPCGTCGRMVRGDALEGTPPRNQPPYDFVPISAAYPWTRGRTGYAPYAVQSCIKLEQLAIESFGYPLRVVDCPTFDSPPGTPCRRTVFKDVTIVPDEYYHRVGYDVPVAVGSRRDVPRPG